MNSDQHRKKKILMVLSGLGAGGAERVTSHMLNHWAQRDCDVGLLTLATLDIDHYEIDSRVQRLGLDIIWESKSKFDGVLSNLRRIRMIRKAVRTYAPDIVISFIDRTNVLVIAALLGSGIPVIASERSDPRWNPIDLPRAIARTVLYPFAAGLVVQTNEVAKWAKTRVSESKIHLIPNPLPAMPDPPPIRSRSQRVIAVGRLVQMKGFDALLKAFAASKMRAAGWSLEIYGDGPEKFNLSHTIDELELSGQASLQGLVPDPWLHMGKARVFVLPSLYEGFPNALIEAMAMGCACIATDCPSGPGDIIRDGVNGLLIPVGDSKALTRALDRLEEDTDLTMRLANAALEARERFDIDDVMQQWDALTDNCA